MSSNASCVTDLDCPKLESCYRNVAWAPDDIFCDCNTFFGWSGDDCLTWGANTYFLVIEVSVVIAICVFALVFATLNCVGICRTAMLPRDLLISFCSVYAVFICHLGWNILVLLGAISPDAIVTQNFIGAADEINTPDPTQKKLGVYESYETYLQAGIYVFSFMALTNIALVWITVIRSVQRLMVGDGAPMIRMVIRCVQFLYFISIVIAFTVANSGDGFAIGILFTMVLLMITDIVYSAALRKFVNLLASVRRSAESTAGLIDLLKKNAQDVVGYILLTVIVLSIYGGLLITGGFKQHCAPDVLCYFTVLRQFGFFLLLAANLNIYVYLRTTIVKRNEKIARDREVSSDANFSSSKRGVNSTV